MAASVAENSSGGPSLFNKLIPISKAVAMMDLTSLYFPGLTRDDRLSLELAHAIQFANVSQFNTKEVSEEDLDANIQAIQDLLTQFKVFVSCFSTLTTFQVLTRQLKASAQELESRKANKMITTKKASLKRTRSDSDFRDYDQQQRLLQPLLDLPSAPPPKRIRRADKEMPSSNTSTTTTTTTTTTLATPTQATPTAPTTPVTTTTTTTLVTPTTQTDPLLSNVSTTLSALQQSPIAKELFQLNKAPQQSENLAWMKPAPWNGAASRFGQ